MIPYGSNPNKTSQFPADESVVNNDFIKFRFRDVVNNKWIIFRAILEAITDTVTPNFGEEKYIGRPEKVYTYSGTDREISFYFQYIPKNKKNFLYLWKS